MQKRAEIGQLQELKLYYKALKKLLCVYQLILDFLDTLEMDRFILSTKAIRLMNANQDFFIYSKQ